MKYLTQMLITIALLFGFYSTASAMQVAGIEVPETRAYMDKTMQLNGVGIRKKAFIKLYVASLYLTEKSQDAATIIADDTPMSIRLAIKSSMISPEKMKKATLDGFNKATGGDTSAIQPQIDALLKTFDEGVEKGDVYEMINMTGSAVHVLRNDQPVATITSAPFKQALFAIWLGEQPVQGNLKKGLLGM